MLAAPGAPSSPASRREEAALRRAPRRGGAAEGWEGGEVPRGAGEKALGRLGWLFQRHPVTLISGDRALT